MDGVRQDDVVYEEHFANEEVDFIFLNTKKRLSVSVHATGVRATFYCPDWEYLSPNLHHAVDQCYFFGLSAYVDPEQPMLQDHWYPLGYYLRSNG